MSPFADNRLSLTARGILAYLVAAGVTTFTVRDIQAAGPNPLDEVAQAIAELERRGYLVSAFGTYSISDHPFWRAR
jgi:hypothetical protein